MARPAARPWTSPHERTQALKRAVLEGGTIKGDSFTDAAFREFTRRERDTRAAVRRQRAPLCTHPKRLRASTMLFATPSPNRARPLLSKLGMFDLARLFVQFLKVSVGCPAVDHLGSEFQGSWRK